MPLLASAEFFKINFFKNSFANTIRVSSSLDPDQDRHIVSPDLDPNCLQKFSTDDKSHPSTERVKCLSVENSFGCQICVFLL